MIDTLMMAYTVEMVSVERVLSCVQRYCPLFPDEDIPYDAEDAVMTWLNKVRRPLPQNQLQPPSLYPPRSLISCVCYEESEVG